MRELYELSDPDFEGRYTVPVLWDSKSRKIVNNESSEIIQMLNTEFDAFAKHPTIDLRPASLSKEIQELNDWQYDRINNGVYKCGFATTQEAYEAAFHSLFEALDEAEKRLATTRFLNSNHQPYGHFKCNKKRIVDYPNLWGWVRDVYQWPGVKETVNMLHIKTSYYASHPNTNPTRIVALGPDIDFDSPHGRDQAHRWE